MNDILPPPKRPLKPLKPPVAPPPTPQPPIAPPQPPTPAPDEGLIVAKKPRRGKRLLIGLLLGMVLLLLAAAAACVVWYQVQLSPVAAGSHQEVRVSIKSGMGPDAIAAVLKQKNLIHSTAGFDWYTKLTHTSNRLQAGAYSLSPGMRLEEIVDHLTSGKTDTITITFLPGATVADDKAVLRKAGYSPEAIDAAFAKSYDSPLFAGKPTSADLEGYVYGETYNFPADASVETILQRTFDQFWSVVEKNDLVSAYKSHGLTLYQGITLASIVQREEGAKTADQKQIAQVFYLRLDKHIPLGSDPTYQYAADKAGVPRDPSLDSPYNTRIHSGLPPGPIAAPGAGALLAVAHPAKGDYLFFLSGDDDKTYFARTQAEHDKNVRDHCQKKCQIL